MYTATNKLLNKLLANKQVNTCYIVNNKKIKVSNAYNYVLQQFVKYNVNNCYSKLFNFSFTQYALQLTNSKKHTKYINTINSIMCNMFNANSKKQTVYNAYKYYFNTLSNTSSCLNIQQRIIFKVLSNIF